MTRVRRTALALSAATFVAAFGLSGCGQSGQPEHPAASPSVETSPAPSVGMPPPAPPAPGGPPLPRDSALIDVMSRLADPAVPGSQKVDLIEEGTADEAAGLDRFGIALRDNGSLPLTFEARDLAWSQANPGNVVATVVVRTANPQGGEFSYPMEFVPAAGSWQLTRQTADLLLQLDDGQNPPPAPPPPPTPPR
ncbi:hypothetical protein [Mycolicibacterium pyrenivorans]|uniref:hypothetical protein n=1 Tax=Mycolicibacterium pyrenivorans TaxID=187102 RepID=UPI003559262B|nr:hypothetical protein [Mycolicibacterium pyrenivorans]